MIKTMCNTVYIIYSKSVEDVNAKCTVLKTSEKVDSAYGTCSFVKPFKHFDENKKPNKFMAIIDQNALQLLRAKGTRCNEFSLQNSDFPRKNDNATALYIPIPKELVSASDNVRNEIVSRMRKLTSLGIVPARSWKTYFTKSGTGCFIQFDKKTQVKDIALAKCVLDGTNWPTTPSFPFECRWAKQRSDKQ